MDLGSVLFILTIFVRADFAGYADSRIFFPVMDSVHFYGYIRGWLEFKKSEEYYGGQAALDLTVPFDTIPAAGFKSGLEISRLALWLGPENLRITAGKQRILWGVARVFRPLDIINPVNFLEPGYERSGFPAILAEFAPGRLTDIRVLCLPRYNLNDATYAGRFGTNLFKNDIGLNVFYRPKESQTVLGADLAGEIAAGYWVEGTFTRDDTSGYGKIAVGLDYTFPGMVYVMAEYFFDMSGESEPDEYDYQKLLSGSRGTLGQNYLYLSLALCRGLVLSPSLNAVGNLDDRTGIIIPRTTCQPWDNIELNFGVNVPVGSRTGEFRRAAACDLMVFVWGKVYF
jgi:hypothetical protein